MSIFWKKSVSLLIVFNVHWWEDRYKMTSCENADLPQDDQMLWLVKDSNKYNILEKIMTDKQFVRDVRKLCHFVHTSVLESFHNVILKYTLKHLFFPLASMNMWMQLAVIDHNVNSGRTSLGQQWPSYCKTTKQIKKGQCTKRKNTAGTKCW